MKFGTTPANRHHRQKYCLIDKFFQRAYTDKIIILLMRSMRLLLLLLFSFPVFGSAQECKSSGNEDFARFFAKFSVDKAFAVSRTIYPLSVVHWHHGMDGEDVAPAKRSERSRQQDEALPSLSAFMQEHALTSQILDADSKAVLVEVVRDGTSWVMTYHFMRKNGCWVLREFQDHSSSNFR